MIKKVARGNSQSQKKPSLEGDNVGGLNSLKEELAEEFPKEFWEQITSPRKTTVLQNSQREGGREIRPGQTINPEQAIQENQNRYQEKINFQKKINLTEVSLRQKDRQKTFLKIEAIRKEISAIAATMAQVNRQVKEIEIAAQDNITQPNRYLVNFLELLLTFLKDLKERVEEGNTWLTAFQKRNKKKNYFWGQVKKSGTRFMLSSDRTPATQAG
ncbi:MAG: DUF5660 domain-containing protein [Candidatus Shapirobacteria bacterium]|nr:DUF5660 domain-containing protein [Candidatus Shapirobacteria bacterium]